MFANIEKVGMKLETHKVTRYRQLTTSSILFGQGDNKCLSFTSLSPYCYKCIVN